MCWQSGHLRFGAVARVNGARERGRKPMYIRAVRTTRFACRSLAATVVIALLAWVAPVTAKSSTPTALYSITLSEAAGTTSTTNSNGTGGKLEDVTATTLQFRVVA